MSGNFLDKSGRPLAAQTLAGTEAIPQRLGRYVLSRQIASGGFGTVYLAFDEELRRPVAIKVPRAGSLLDVEAYLIEARTAARLSHAGIVPVYDAGRQADGTPYVVMMYVDGPSLEDLITRSQRLPLEKTADLLCQVADALHHAHTQGFVSRRREGERGHKSISHSHGLPDLRPGS